MKYSIMKYTGGQVNRHGAWLRLTNNYRVAGMALLVQQLSIFTVELKILSLQFQSLTSRTISIIAIIGTKNILPGYDSISQVRV